MKFIIIIIKGFIPVSGLIIVGLVIRPDSRLPVPIDMQRKIDTGILLIKSDQLVIVVPGNLILYLYPGKQVPFLNDGGCRAITGSMVKSLLFIKKASQVVQVFSVFNQLPVPVLFIDQAGDGA